MPGSNGPVDLVLWSDDALVVANKPAGLLTLPDGYDATIPYLRQTLETEFGRLWVVHRLDRETSGVIVLARSAIAHHGLNDQFAARQVQKTYHAIVHGTPLCKEWTVDQPLRKNGDRSHRTVIDPRYGKPAQTSFRLLEQYPGFSLVEARPHTGYTHQIRAHLAYDGYPIAGDGLYRGNPELPEPVDPVISRVALHALEIRFIHPITHEPLLFSAPYPDDFQRAIKRLTG